MNIRAIHLEKLDTLETQSYINGMRRFISQRGLPKKIFSDNGTNFVGPNSEIKQEFRNFVTKKQVDWSFNPPHVESNRKLGRL